MPERLVYLLGVVLIGWIVTFGLRALPFLLFAGREKPLPAWVGRFGSVISPVIIFGLIVYSYSGLEWRTLWPYLAGALTVGLHLWKHNPLASILAGTVVYICLLSCGCVTERTLVLDAAHPSFAYEKGVVRFGEDVVSPDEVVEILEENDIPRDRTIHIQITGDMSDLDGARTLIGTLALGGYSRSVLVTKRHADAVKGDGSPRRLQPSPPQTKSPTPRRRVVRPPSVQSNL